MVSDDENDYDGDNDSGDNDSGGNVDDIQTTRGGMRRKVLVKDPAQHKRPWINTRTNVSMQ